MLIIRLQEFYEDEEEENGDGDEEDDGDCEEEDDSGGGADSELGDEEEDITEYNAITTDQNEDDIDADNTAEDNTEQEGDNDNIDNTDKENDNNSDKDNNNDSDEEDDDDTDEEGNNSDEEDTDGDNGDDNGDDDNADDLPWNQKKYWSRILHTFPNVEEFAFFVEKLDRADRFSTNYKQDVAKVLASTHSVCPKLRKFTIHCSQPDRWVNGRGSCLGATIVFTLKGEHWEKQSHEVKVGRLPKDVRKLQGGIIDWK